MAAAWSPILLLLLLWGQSAAARHWALCRPGPLSARHPVLGFWEQIRAGSGCASRGRSASGREVHVLILRGPVGRMGARQVSLELGPAPPGRPPIFVLSSPAPVVWSLQTAQVALGEQWTFQVSPGSRVSALGGVTVTETRLPQTPRGLLRWAREEHGGVSSLAAYRGVNMVYVQLGDDGVSPGACKLRRNFLSPTHFASGLRPRPLWGCLTSDPPSDPEVHVILSKGARPRPPAHLTVELQAPGGCCSPRRELIVVLKSEASTSWLVQIPHLAGRLRVLASHEVSVSGTEPEPDLAVSSSMSLGLAYASDPMAWAMEQGLPGVTSYTEAEQVNRFLVIVGLDGDAKAPHPSIPLPRPAKISPMVWERSRAAPGGGRTVRLAGALSVACLSERVAVYVNKDMLQAARLSPARVTLRDPSCAAQSNGTHFLLESPLAGCGALRIPALDPTSGVGRYQNAVVLWGSGPGAEPEGPPLPVGQAEDSLESIEFSCSSPALSETSRSAEPIPDLPLHLGRVLLSLEVYSSEAFAKAQGPCTVSANSRVFVEAALAAFDPRLSFSIRLCFLSPSSSSSLDSPYTLVRGGCPAHPDVSLHPPHKGAAGPALSPGSQELQRLSFLLRPLYNDSIQFLHCRLALCTQEPQGQAGAYGGALPKCGPQACPSSRVGEPGSGRFQHTFTKPIIVTVGRLARATKPTPGTDPFLVPFPLAGRRGKMLKEAPRPEQGETPPAPLPQGLELPTVVGIVFSAFIIGVSLTGGLWLIHSRTAHRGLPVRVLGNTLAAAPLSPPAGARPCGSRDQQPIGLCSAQPGRPLGEGPLHLARRAPSL
ncbi:dual specificity mitogen-activated protein kinase kinase 7 isoform X3 [Mauremys reevesii]|uniref:dual specificity mitogen-activated protein kinase kinase 7 isoform X3 n=1 Tax=Mauremys reevesii TaxID=260615 RepID=UPI00193FD155|nr:dual specificity mitogen-activated protein kinase kinase 7 isoform X3 [Mauremys reevesii]